MAIKRPSSESDSKPTKKAKVLQKFLPDYTISWPVLKPSKKGATYCYCDTCRLNFSVGHGGRDDCKRHVASKRLSDFVKLRKACPSVSSVFKKMENPLKDKITHAEALLVSTLAGNNLPIASKTAKGTIWMKHGKLLLN